MKIICKGIKHIEQGDHGNPKGVKMAWGLQSGARATREQSDKGKHRKEERKRGVIEKGSKSGNCGFVRSMPFYVGQLV